MLGAFQVFSLITATREGDNILDRFTVKSLRYVK